MIITLVLVVLLAISAGINGVLLFKDDLISKSTHQRLLQIKQNEIDSLEEKIKTEIPTLIVNEIQLGQKMYYLSPEKEIKVITIREVVSYAFNDEIYLFGHNLMNKDTNLRQKLTDCFHTIEEAEENRIELINKEFEKELENYKNQLNVNYSDKLK